MSAVMQMMMIAKPLPDIVYLVTISGTGNYIAPAGYNKVTVEAIAAGGNGYGEVNPTAGGGGAYAKTENLAVTGGSTVVYYRVAADSYSSSWVRVGTNSAPTSATQGCKADSGTPGRLGVNGAGGSVTDSIGTTCYAGGSGYSTLGGGAGGDGGAGSDGTGGGTGDMKGGDGGNQAVGQAPGGGGGANSGNSYAGAKGRVRITFKP